MRIAICTLVMALAGYVYINARNHLIEIQLAIPPLQKKLKETVAENGRLQFQIDRFCAPSHLMKIAEKEEYLRLKPVDNSKVVTIYE